MKTVIVIDDHPVIAVGIGLALRESSQFKLAGVVAEPSACMPLVEHHRPDALILDLVFNGIPHLSLIPQCRVAVPAAAIVVFSSLPERLFARKAMDAGADAYVSKSTDLPTLLQLLEDVVHRPTPASPAPTADAGAPRGFALEGVYLTPREIEIAQDLGRGLSIAAIAHKIGISANTVAVHRDNIRKKLDCRDTNELVARLARLDASTYAPR